MTQTTSLETFFLLAPEITLVGAALVAFLGGAFAGLRSGWGVSLVGIVIAMALVGGQSSDGATIASGGIMIDGFSTFIRWLVLASGALLALVQSGDLFRSAVSRLSGLQQRFSQGSTCEEAGTFLILLAGLSLVGVASDLVLLFVGLELVSIPTYILLSLKRTDAHGQEACLKYFFLSLIASSLFLYAAVCLYGIGGSTNLVVIGDRLRSSDESIGGIVTVLLPVTLAMAMAGVAFRLAAVPMHFYAPDVYEGTSPGNAALLSTLPKVAGIVVLVRLVSLGIPATLGAVGSGGIWYLTLFWQLTAVLAAVTMTVGNVLALMQTNLRRLLACSSIAHAGYLLVGVAVAAAAASGEADRSLPVIATGSLGLGGLGATLFYLATYLVATIGIFAALTYLGHRWPEWTSASGPRPPREEIATIDDLNGLSSTNPVAAFSIALFLLSLAGIPPLPGFWGKLSLAISALEIDFNSAIAYGNRRAACVALAVILVVNAAIAAAYYLQIIAAIYFRSTKRGVQADGGLSAGVAMLLCLALALMVTLQPRGLFISASRAGSDATVDAQLLPDGQQARIHDSNTSTP
ncbi:MAG: NADH-quinone oxidoreductase subunit N [Planctomycetia bacterium]|nr:NADH-quinone oxidoreductase subunit N [Planctomycetia bacterium]RLT15230.1 MAG: NADH-quinone oxidoreductase subunit N [Planctomycetota bacterium]